MCALPSDSSLRARALLQRMFADFASSGSLHPLPSIPAVIDVFLVPLPINGAASSDEPSGHQHRILTAGTAPAGPAAPGSPYGISHPAGSQLAVVDFSRAFADAHPSGVECEQLTLQAVLATLQANFPQVDEVLFLVDGAPRATLNGHADLSRPYAVREPSESIHVLSQNGSLQ